MDEPKIIQEKYSELLNQYKHAEQVIKALNFLIDELKSELVAEQCKPKCSCTDDYDCRIQFTKK